MNADHVGREVTVNVLGQDWTFSRFDREIEHRYCEFAAKLLPDPIEVLSRNLDKIALKDAAIKRQLYIDDLAERKKAADEGRPAILLADQYVPFADVMAKMAIDKSGLYLGYGSPEVNSTLNSTQGASYLVYLLLKPKHPDITEARAREVMDAVEGQLKDILLVVRGKLDALPKNEQGQPG